MHSRSRRKAAGVWSLPARARRRPVRERGGAIHRVRRGRGARIESGGARLGAAGASAGAAHVPSLPFLFLGPLPGSEPPAML